MFKFRRAQAKASSLNLVNLHLTGVADHDPPRAWWRAPGLFEPRDSIVAAGERTRRRLHELLRDAAPPATNGDKRPAFGHIVVGMPYQRWELEEIERGGQDTWQQERALESLHRATFGKRGAAKLEPRVVILPGDLAEGSLVAYAGFAVHIPAPGERPVATLTATLHEGQAQHQIAPDLWQRYREAPDGSLILETISPALYRGQEMVALGGSIASAPIVLPRWFSGPEACRSIFLDLRRGRAMAGGPSGWRIAEPWLDGGHVVAFELEQPGPSGAPERLVIRLDYHDAAALPAIFRDRPAASKAPPAATSQAASLELPGFLRDGPPAPARRPSAFARMFGAGARREVPAAIRPRQEPVVARGGREPAERNSGATSSVGSSTLVPVPRATPSTYSPPSSLASGTITPMAAARPSALAKRGDDPPVETAGRLQIVAMALPRLDGHDNAFAWYLPLDSAGQPLIGIGRTPALELACSVGGGLQARRPGGSWEPASAADYDSWLSPPAAELESRFLAFLALEDRSPQALVSGASYVFGRRPLSLAGSTETNLSPLALEEIGRVEKHRRGPSASLGAYGLSDHDAGLTLNHGELTLGIAKATTPIWHLGAENRVVDRLAPGDVRNLHLRPGERFLIGLFVIAWERD